MHASKLVVVLCVACQLAGVALRGQPRVSITSNTGASVVFEQRERGWTLAGISTPGAVAGIAVTERCYDITAGGVTETSNTVAPWALVEATPDRIALEYASDTLPIQLRRVVTFGPADNVLRIETWARAVNATVSLDKITLFAAHFAGEAMATTGDPGQSFPVFGQHVFVGVEHVSAECAGLGDIGFAAQSPHLQLTSDWRLVAPVVIGWPVPGADVAPGQEPMRAAFLHYLDTVRVKPRDIELHTNTWWTLPLPFSEADVLRNIQQLREGFYDRTGMFFDSYALDLGWSDRHSVWRVDADRFPNGLRTVNDRLHELGSRLGLWISPGSAYPEGLDNAWLAEQGYEMTPSTMGSTGQVPCFALGGRYQEAVRSQIVQYAADLQLGHVKLDFMDRGCAVAEHGHAVDGAGFVYVANAGLADVLDSLRAVNPGMATEPLCCGYPPSPWWTMHTPFVLGPNGGDVPNGRVPAPAWFDSLITARDIAYRAAQKKWLMPTQALETFDVVVQSPGDFQNMAVMAVGRGRWFLSTYLNPEYMQPEEWDFLAALVRWTRANRQYLEDAQMFGGAPELKQAYGYLFHTLEKDVYCVRNPWIESRTIQLPVPSLTTGRDVRMIYPRTATVARIAPGAAGPKITLAPYETVMLETVPTSTANKIVPVPAKPKATVNAVSLVASAGPGGTLRYNWKATVDVPAGVSESELCILVQGGATVQKAVAELTVDGAPVELAKSGNAGEFAAATSAPVENWTWFRAPIDAGVHQIRITVGAPGPASVGIYTCGTTPAYHEPAPEGSLAFPAYHPTRRVWTETLSPLKAYSTKASRVTSPK
jgi:hypothetical protein